MDNDIEIYKNKKFSDLCKDIVKNSENNRDQLDILISDLRSMIKTANDALMIVPLIKEYLDVQVKNNDHLVRMASVVQRAMTNSASAGSSDLLISEEEKEQLLLEVKKMGDETKQLEHIDTNATKILENGN